MLGDNDKITLISVSDGDPVHEQDENVKEETGIPVLVHETSSNSFDDTSGSEICLGTDLHQNEGFCNVPKHEVPKHEDVRKNRYDELRELQEGGKFCFTDEKNWIPIVSLKDLPQMSYVKFEYKIKGGCGEVVPVLLLVKVLAVVEDIIAARVMEENGVPQTGAEMKWIPSSYVQNMAMFDEAGCRSRRRSYVPQ